MKKSEIMVFLRKCILPGIILTLLACLHTSAPVNQDAPVLEVPSVSHSPMAPVSEDHVEANPAERHFTLAEEKGFYFIKFDTKKLPKGTFYIEAIYGENYLGYFVLGETIAVPKPSQGKVVFLYYVLDGVGDRLIEEPFKTVLP